MNTRHKKRFPIFSARSISEEFSSGDTSRFRDEEYDRKPEPSTSSTTGTHSRSDSTHKTDKERDKREKRETERDEGKYI